MLAKLGDLSKRDEFAQYLKNFAQKVASVKFHNSFDKMQCFNQNCKTKLCDNYEECVNQDLLERTKMCKGRNKFWAEMYN